MPETPVTPLRQPPAEDLRNAIFIAECWMTQTRDPESRGAFEDVVRLIRAALDKLAEPSPEVIAATQKAIAAVDGACDDAREARDVAAVVLRVALSGEQK